VAEESGSKIVYYRRSLEAAKDADILYTDALVSMVKTRLAKELKDLIAFS